MSSSTIAHTHTARKTIVKAVSSSFLFCVPFFQAFRFSRPHFFDPNVTFIKCECFWKYSYGLFECRQVIHILLACVASVSSLTMRSAVLLLLMEHRTCGFSSFSLCLSYISRIIFPIKNFLPLIMSLHLPKLHQSFVL